MSEDSGDGRPRLSLSQIAQLAEVVASLAVLLTLLFLVLEVSQNTQTVQATSYDRSMEAMNEWRLTIATDPDLTRMYAAHVLAGAPREPGVRVDQLQMILNSLWGIYENAYYLNVRGLLGEAEWSRFERQICAAVTRGRRDERWDSVGGSRPLLTEQFASYVDASCVP